MKPVRPGYNHNDLILVIHPTKHLPCGSLFHAFQDWNLPGIKGHSSSTHGDYLTMAWVLTPNSFLEAFY